MQCAGNPHFWVNEDGSYQEEGQKNTKGYIWGKVGFLRKDVLDFVKIFSPLLSYLSFPYCLIDVGFGLIKQFGCWT